MNKGSVAESVGKLVAETRDGLRSCDPNEPQKPFYEGRTEALCALPLVGFERAAYGRFGDQRELGPPRILLTSPKKRIADLHRLD